MFTLVFCIPWIVIASCLLFATIVSLVKGEPLLKRLKSNDYRQKHQEGLGMKVKELNYTARLNLKSKKFMKKSKKVKKRLDAVTKALNENTEALERNCQAWSNHWEA